MGAIHTTHVWQRIQAEGAKLRVAATFQDDAEIFSATSNFPSPLLVPLAETVTLIGTYVQLEGEMRVAQVDVRRPFDIIKLLVSRISSLIHGNQLWEIKGKEMQQEIKELIVHKDGLKAKNATLQDRIMLLEKTRSTAEAENKITQLQQSDKSLPNSDPVF